MLTIDLQKIVQDINNRRSRVKYEFQEVGLMLAEKLGDPHHKAIYMHLAKVEERELLMDALHHVLASPNASGNMGALFMWKLKEIKNRPLEPLTLRFEVDEGHFRVGLITDAVRGDMPLILAALDLYQEEHPEELRQDVVWISTNVKYATARVGKTLPTLTEYLENVLSKYKRKVTLIKYSTWQFYRKKLEVEPPDQIESEYPVKKIVFTGALWISNPIAIKREFKRNPRYKKLFR